MWPGDTPFESRWSERLGEGGSRVNLSSFQTTSHAGSHVDAPLHYDPDGASIDQCSLELFAGPARVVDVTAFCGVVSDNRVPAEAVIGALEGTPPRVLLKTGTYRPVPPFTEGFAGVSLEAIDLLFDHGVQLLGIDTPSVDPYRDEEIPAHRRLAEHGILIIEGLVLDSVPQGDYELIALPLRLKGLEASPVRAVLRSL